MKNRTITIPIGEIITQKEFEELKKKAEWPMFVGEGSDMILLLGDTTYDYRIAQFLKEKSPEEIKKLGILARLDELEREKKELQKELSS